MDVLYVVRPGEANDELRYSLRSIAANLPHDRVWIAGHCPSWVRGVEHIPVEQARPTKTSIKYPQALANIRAALADDRLSDDVIFCNDDFYVMQPVAEVPVLNAGTYAEHIAEYSTRHQGRYARSRYTQAMRDTAALLEEWGHADPLSFQLHVPRVINRRGVLDVIDRAHKARAEHDEDWRSRLQWYSLWANEQGLTGETIADVKVYDGRKPRRGPFLSSDDRSFPRVRRLLVGTFPKACRYEVA